MVNGHGTTARQSDPPDEASTVKRRLSRMVSGAPVFKQTSQLLMPLGESMFLGAISLLPTSLKAIRQLLLKLATQGIQHHQAGVHCLESGLSLRTARNPADRY
jgi:hypothetical protein